MSTGAPNLLQYEQRPSWWRVRRRHVIAGVSLLAVVIAGVGWWKRDAWYPQTVQQGKLLLAQWECTRYTADPTCLVYSNDPADITRLKGALQYMLDPRDDGSVCLMFHPDCLANLDKCAARSANLDLFDSSDYSTVFLHERRTHGGHRRIVLVECVHVRFRSEGLLAGPQDYSFLQCSTLKPAGLIGAPEWEGAEVADGQFMPNQHHFGDVHPLPDAPAIIKSCPPERIFAGQIDPADDAAFTIRCQFGDKNWFIDGRLEHIEGDLVKVAFKSRDVPRIPRPIESNAGPKTD